MRTITRATQFVPVSRIVYEALLRQNVVENEKGENFPCFISTLPDSDDVVQDVITIIDYANIEGSNNVRNKITGSNEWRPSVHVVLRTLEYNKGWNKINEISDFMDSINRLFVGFTFNPQQRIECAIHFAKTILMPSFAGLQSNMQGNSMAKYQIFETKYEIVFEDFFRLVQLTP